MIRRGPRRLRRVPALAPLVAVALLAAGCSDAGASDSATATTTTPPTTAPPTSSPADAPSPPMLDDELAAQLQSVTEQVVAELDAPGAVVAVTTPDDRWESAVGVKDLTTGEPMETGLRWPLRSITKSFVVTLVLELVDEGEIRLDDTLDRWVDGVPNGDRVTVRQLAGMTSGLPDYFSDAFVDDFVAEEDRVFTDDELIAYATERPARAEPGTDRVYTNVNGLLLGRIVEQVTGQPLDEVLRQRLLDPLGLDETTYPTGPEEWSSDASGYALTGGVLEPRVVNHSIFGSAGAMIGTTDDMARWGPVLASGSLLDPATQEQRREGGPVADSPEEPAPEYDLYGLGLARIAGWWGHTGEGLGFTSLVLHDPAIDTTVVIMMNLALPVGHPPGTLFRRLAPLLDGG